MFGSFANMDGLRGFCDGGRSLFNQEDGNTVRAATSTGRGNTASSRRRQSLGQVRPFCGIGPLGGCGRGADLVQPDQSVAWRLGVGFGPEPVLRSPDTAVIGSTQFPQSPGSCNYLDVPRPSSRARPDDVKNTEDLIRVIEAFERVRVARLELDAARTGRREGLKAPVET